MDDQIKGFQVNSKGFGIIPKLAMQDRNLHINAKAIYAYFNSFAGNGDTCFPTRKKICYDLGISNDTFSKYLKQLVVNGYIIVEQVKENGRFSHNVYTMCSTILPCPKISDTENIVNGRMDTNINNSNINNNSNNNNSNIYVGNENQQHGNEKKAKNNQTIDEIINYLNLKAGTSFKAKTKDTVKHINARLSEGFTVDEFKVVIDKKCADWLGTEWQQYLRPATLFGTKFESYLNAKQKRPFIQQSEPTEKTATDIALDSIFS